MTDPVSLEEYSEYDCYDIRDLVQEIKVLRDRLLDYEDKIQELEGMLEDYGIGI